MKKLFIMTIISVMCLSAVAGNGRGNRNGGQGGNGNENFAVYVESIPAGDVDENEKAALLFLVEEEKLARDVYLGLYEKWGLRVFDNISRSEQTHMNAVSVLFERYSIENPVDGEDQGVFENAELQSLYSDLMEKGSISLIDALLVGATIEDLDIHDLQNDISVTDNEDLLVVFQNLMKGSRNHLRAFVSVLEANSVSYTAQYLTQEEVDAIVSSDRERGLVDAEGNSIFTGRGGRN